ncbi:MAG: VanZ family protein [Acidobacteriaceae bacterium]
MMQTHGTRRRSELGDLRLLTGAICICILVVILIAGLWPFLPKKNDVQWLQGENGLRFGHRGIVVSSQAFRVDRDSGSCSLEIYLRPGSISGSGTFLALDDNPDPRYVFALRQFDTGLAVQRPALDARGNLVRQWWKTNRVFTEGQSVVLTITAVRGETTLYVDGVQANASSQFGLSSAELNGDLILGNSATQDSWHGEIMGLAMYASALTPAEVEEHASRWLQGQAPASNNDNDPLALYRFDERSGSVIQDRSAAGNSLLIRPRYFLLHPAFLQPVWKPFRSRWDGWMTRGYWSDVVINIVGFIPFGFFFALRFSLTPGIARPRLTALLLGFAISLAIETLQYFLPTRDSSMTDLLNNTIGTALGVALCRPTLAQKLRAGRFAAAAVSPAGNGAAGATQPGRRGNGRVH